MKLKAMIFFICGFILSFVCYSVAAFSYNVLDDLKRTQAQLQKQQVELSRKLRKFGFDDFDSGSSRNAAGTHSEFIALPNELKKRSLVHIKCDCRDLASEGHYCGSHALTHAIDIEQTHGSRQDKKKRAQC